MAFDSLTLSVLTDEFKQLLIGGKISKIYQPEKDEIVLHIFNKANFRLLISSNASVNRIHLTEKQSENPTSAPSFCMLLRKHITNAQIVDISQMPFERVLDFSLKSKSELGYERQFNLIFELTGKTSNIFLCADNYTVLDSIKHLPQDLSTSRIILNGGKYSFFPEREKICPNNLLKIKCLLESNKNTAFDTLLRQSLLGVSAQTINEMLFGVDKTSVTDVTNGIQSYLKNLQNKKPNIVFSNGSQKDVCPFDYKSQKGEKVFFETLNAAHDSFFFNQNRMERFNNKAKSIVTVVKNAISRTEKKLAIQKQSILDSKNNVENKMFGDLILSNIWKIKSTDNKFVTENFFLENSPTVTIPLEIGLSPQQNAQRYFKKYQKQKSTLFHNQALVEQNQKVLEHLISVQHSLKFCTDQSDLNDIVDELTQAGILKGKKQTAKKQTQLPSRPLMYDVSGFRIFVGKNNFQNNEVTFKIAKPHDIWLHTQGIHSSHVLIETHGQNVPAEVLLVAAEICAFFSQARQGSKIAVDYTAKINVKKPKGKAPLGFVVYNNFSTLIVNPSEHQKRQITINK